MELCDVVTMDSDDETIVSDSDDGAEELDKKTDSLFHLDLFTKSQTNFSASPEIELVQSRLSTTTIDDFVNHNVISNAPMALRELNDASIMDSDSFSSAIRNRFETITTKPSGFDNDAARKLSEVNDFTEALNDVNRKILSDLSLSAVRNRFESMDTHRIGHEVNDVVTDDPIKLPSSNLGLDPISSSKTNSTETSDVIPIGLEDNNITTKDPIAVPTFKNALDMTCQKRNLNPVSSNKSNQLETTGAVPIGCENEIVTAREPIKFYVFKLDSNNHDLKVSSGLFSSATNSRFETEDDDSIGRNNGDVSPSEPIKLKHFDTNSDIIHSKNRFELLSPVLFQSPVSICSQQDVFLNTQKELDSTSPIPDTFKTLSMVPLVGTPPEMALNPNNKTEYDDHMTSENINTPMKHAFTSKDYFVYRTIGSNQSTPDLSGMLKVHQTPNMSDVTRANLLDEHSYSINSVRAASITVEMHNYATDNTNAVTMDMDDEEPLPPETSNTVTSRKNSDEDLIIDLTEDSPEKPKKYKRIEFFNSQISKTFAAKKENPAIEENEDENVPKSSLSAQNGHFKDSSCNVEAQINPETLDIEKSKVKKKQNLTQNISEGRTKRTRTTTNKIVESEEIKKALGCKKPKTRSTTLNEKIDNSSTDNRTWGIVSKMKTKLADIANTLNADPKSSFAMEHCSMSLSHIKQILDTLQNFQNTRQCPLESADDANLEQHLRELSDQQRKLRDKIDILKKDSETKDSDDQDMDGQYFRSRCKDLRGILKEAILESSRIKEPISTKSKCDAEVSSSSVYNDQDTPKLGKQVTLNICSIKSFPVSKYTI